ncbi:acylphosphatase [Staphylococcus lutrae]|uniref:acylphosphatase n=1 Tax=Staphylococcus lutrae TaxID=155085 RepID=A0AAC9RVF5_9STAP|nr:acylphosphatase [Staphylococcus lutrae]ARJ51830.1 acylphosphatase [Staphylococcus lutrae]PNZ36071.1 acylphosphatase [Staphylococcus lutrae]
MKHYLIQVHGRVQGVGFRYFTKRLALKYQIVGTVQNRDDYVVVYAQGETLALESFTQAVIQGASPASHVTNYTINELELNQEYKSFRALT